jgi:hypothetical protein
MDVIVVVCDCIAGVAAHNFRRRGFEFDSGPSFYCGFSGEGDTLLSSINSVKQVLDVL